MMGTGARPGMEAGCLPADEDGPPLLTILLVVAMPVPEEGRAARPLVGAGQCYF